MNHVVVVCLLSVYRALDPRLQCIKGTMIVVMHM